MITQTIRTAKKFTLGRPPPRFPQLPGATTPLELNTALLAHPFPFCPIDDPQTILLPFWDVAALEESEVERALACSSP